MTKIIPGTPSVEAMDNAAAILTNLFKESGFALLVFPPGESQGGQLSYVSNVEFVSMIAALKEFILATETPEPTPERSLH